MERSMCITLIGFMGSGKTALGKRLSNELNLPLVDLDAYIENREQQSIATIFSERGEGHFREIETVALNELLQRENLVLSCGGGTPCFHQNMEAIKSHSLSIYLEANAGALVSRLAGAAETRPLIAGKTPEELHQFVTTLLEQRAPYYQQATWAESALSWNATRVKELATRIRAHYCK